MAFSLKLLGGVVLTGAEGPLSGPAAQRHRLALLALLAAARPRAVSRDKVMAMLWPERETESARRLLNQAVHVIRQALGADAIVSAGEELQLDSSVIECDVVGFETALARGEAERAVALYGGPFLDGFFLVEAPEFERWVERERERLAGSCARALEELAGAAERAGDPGEAVTRWKARAALDPYDSRVALRVMRALEAAGNRAGAIQHGLQHQQRLRLELEIDADREVQVLMDRLRREPPASSAPSQDSPSTEPTSETAAISAEPAPLAAGTRRSPRVFAYVVLAILGLLLAGGAVRLLSRSEGDRARPATAGSGSPVPVDEIARAVARELDLRQRGETGRTLPELRTGSLAAYELVLRGQDPVLIRSDSGARKGLEYFQRAVALDSNYAAAWVGLARLTVRASSPADRKRAIADGEKAALRALALDDSLAEAHALLGVYLAMTKDYAAGEGHFRRALALEPRRARIREWYVSFLLMTERREEALAEARLGVELDPLSPTTNAELARALSANGRCGEALAVLDRLKTVEPQPLRVPAIAAECHAKLQRWSEAVAALRPQAARDSGGTLALLGYMTARSGNREEAVAIQQRLMAQWRAGGLDALNLAFVPAALGDRDEAFAWLERALADGSLGLAPGLRVDLSGPPFDVLRDDPRMDRLREELGLQKR
jgi:DNA-binding SARP family transcriptional activator/Tfp pilus assembly protein PilF